MNSNVLFLYKVSPTAFLAVAPQSQQQSQDVDTMCSGISAQYMRIPTASPNPLSQAAQTSQTCLSRQPQPQTCRNSILTAMLVLVLVKVGRLQITANFTLL